MYNISYPNFNNNSFCYNNQVIQNSKCIPKKKQMSFGENIQNALTTTQLPNQKTVYVPTKTPNGNGSGVNIIIYNPAVVPGNNTTFNNHYTESPKLNSINEEKLNQTQMPTFENESQNDKNI